MGVIEIETDIHGFVTTCIQSEEGASTTLSDMHAEYEAFCLAHGLPALGWVAFGMALYRAGLRTNVSTETEDPVMLMLAQRRWQNVCIRLATLERVYPKVAKPANVFHLRGTP